MTVKPDPVGIEFDRVEVRIGGRLILGPIDLRIDAGERWMVLGANGSGKTTMLAVAGARRQPSSGRATVLGQSLGYTQVHALHTRIGHISQALAELMPPGTPVRDIVLTGRSGALVPWLQEYDQRDLDRAYERLRAVGCESLADRSFESCSQGERQRVLLARALFGEAALLILDEPAAGLDLPARETLIRVLDALVKDRPSTILMATHHLEEVPGSATHAILLREGRKVAAGQIGDILTPAHLRETFDMGMEVGRRSGRWWATAAR